MPSSHYFYSPSPRFSSFAPPLWFCAVPLLLPVRAHLRPSMHYPSISFVVNIMYTSIHTFCENLNVLYIFDQTYLYRVEVRLELNGANPRLIVSPPSLSPSHPPTPLPSRWPALTALPPLAKFQLVWRRCVKLCCLAPPSLARNIRLCCLV